MTIKVTGVPQTLVYVKRRSDEEVKEQTSSIMDSLILKLKEATPVDTGKARDGWYKTKRSIDNDVEYIDRLNAGSSKQAPAHFVEKVVLSEPGVSPGGIIVESK